MTIGSKRNGVAICQRSGVKYPISQMVYEPGTNLFVHKDLSDGEYNLLTHPVNRVVDFTSFGDPFSVPNARPRPKGERDELASALNRWAGKASCTGVCKASGSPIRVLNGQASIEAVSSVEGMFKRTLYVNGSISGSCTTAVDLTDFAPSDWASEDWV